MADLIYLKQESLARYKTLILRKYELIQECNQLKVEFTRVFGDLMLAAFRAQLECLKKKKTIEFCQVYLNRKQEPDVEEMQEFVRKETATLRGYLQDHPAVFPQRCADNTGCDFTSAGIRPA